MIFLFILILEEISISSCMDTSVCRSGNAITICKYGKSSCHGNCFIIPGIANKSIVSKYVVTIPLVYWVRCGA